MDINSFALGYSAGRKTGGSGGGSSDVDVISALIDGSITEIESDCESICGYALYGNTKLESVNFPKVTVIHNYAFYGCKKLKSVNFPKVTVIHNCAFRGCSALTSVDFPSAIRIGNESFRLCSELISANLPIVTQIDLSAFWQCTKLESVRLPSNPPYLQSPNSFSDVPTTCVFYIPTGSLPAYQSATNWSSLTSKHTFIEEDRA